MKNKYDQYTSNLEINDTLIEAVTRTIKEKDLSWPFGVTKEFEQAISEFMNVKFVLAHCNGTSAMYSAMFAVGIGEDTEVICPTYTFWASIAPAANLGAKVVFCDINEDDLLINLTSLKNSITSKTRAIVVPHLWGRPADIEGIKNVCAKYSSQKIYIIEDASHCVGARIGNRFLGTQGDVGIFSLQAGKCLVAGEGGVLVTNDFHLFDRSVYFGHYERIKHMETSDFKAYAKTGGGYKFRIHPLGAAMALNNLKGLPEKLEHQNSLMNCLEQNLSDVEGMRVAARIYDGFSYGGRFGFRILIDLPSDKRKDFIREGTEIGLEIEEEYIPLLHKEKFFLERGVSKLLHLTTAERLHKSILSLPVFYRGSQEIIDEYSKDIIELYQKHQNYEKHIRSNTKTRW